MESIGTPENLVSIINELSRLGNEITDVSDEQSLFLCLSKNTFEQLRKTMNLEVHLALLN